MSDFTRLRDVMAHHEQDDLIVATVTLEEEIMAIVKSAGGEALTPKAWDIILRENLEIFEHSVSSSVWLQFFNLWMRRTRTFWFKPRVLVSAFLVHIIVTV